MYTIPAMIRIGAVSPIARLMARMDPVIMPGIAAGKVTFHTTCQRVAPKPSAPARSEEGTARRDSCELMMITGKITSINVNAPANTPRPKGS